MSDQPVPTSDGVAVGANDPLTQNSSSHSSPVSTRLSDSARQLLQRGVQPPDPQHNNAATLATFDSILTEAEQMPVSEQQSDAIPPVDQAQSTPAGANKERVEGSIGSGASVAELPGGLQYVESEPNPEIPPEVESYLSNVDDHPEKQPQEIVTAVAAKQTYSPPPPKRTVRVLPITKEEAEAAKGQGVQHSIRWLYEFSQKLTKLFFNSVIYRSELPNEKM